MEAAAEIALDNIIDEYIEDNLLPEVILEIINTNNAYKDYGLYSSDYRAVVMIADELQEVVITEIVTTATKEILDFLVGDYLRKRHEAHIIEETNDPILLLRDDMVKEQIDTMMEDLVKVSIRDLLLDYIIETNYVMHSNNYWLPVLCTEIVQEAGNEEAIDRFFDQCWEIVQHDQIMEVIYESVEAEKDRLEGIALEQAFEKYLHRLLMGTIVDKLNGLDEEKREYEEAGMVGEDELYAFDLDPEVPEVQIKPTPSVSQSVEKGTFSQISKSRRSRFAKAVHEEESSILNSSRR